MYRTPKQRLEHETEQNRRHEEIMLAHDFAVAYPELTYAECLRHAYAKLRKERQQA